MKGGTTQTQQTSQTDTSNIKKPTAEQIRYAELLNNEDLKVVQDQIKQVADVTGRSIDEVSVALHDCNYDTEQAINTLLEGNTDQNEWITSSSRKKKHQVTGQGVDNIFSSGQPTREGQRQSRGGRGGRNRTSEKNWELDQKDNDENKPLESGRGRGMRDDRSADRKPPGGRGGSSRRGRGGSKGRSSSRGRGGKIGRSGPPSIQPMNNGPTENGTEMWDSPETNDDKTKTESWEDSAKPSDNWGTVKEPVAPASMSSLFSSVQQSNSWSSNDAKDQVSSWGNSDSVPGTVTSNGPSTTSVREPSTDNTPFAPESVDMAIIHSKIAQSPSRTSEQSQNNNTDMPMMRIPLPGRADHNHLGPISKLLDSVSVTSLSQQTAPSVSHMPPTQPQRQPKQSRTRKSQKSQIPQQPVEMPDSMMDELDVQFGNLEFGGDFSGSPGKGQSKDSAVTLSSEEHLVSKQNDVQVSRPVESESISNLPSTLSRSVPITIASTTSATSSLTGLEDSSPRHYQHASPREHKSQIKPEPIAFPKQTRDLSEDSHPAQVPERSRTPPAIPASSDKSSLGAVTRSQPISSATLQSQLVSSLPKESALDSRVYSVNQHVSSQPLSNKEQLSNNLAHHSTLGGSTMVTSSQRSESSSSHTIQPPPGVGVPHSTTQQATSSMGLSTATVSSSNRPAQHSGKPSLPPGVLPMSTLYGIQQPGMMPAYSMPFNYEDLQRQMQMQAYYDMMQAQAPLQGRDSLQGTYQSDQKFGRSDASSPVQTTMNQANQGQHHLQQQQQAYLNAGTMPPYGYGGLAFYPSGVMPSGFPTYSGPQMYQQMAPKTHGNVSQYQPAYSNQHGTHNYTSGYDDLGVGHDFGKSPYHSAVSQTQSKSTSVVSTSTDLGGSSYKTQLGKFGESKGFLGGTPPPSLNLSVQGQHSHLGNFPGHTTPFVSMLPPTQQQHPHSLFHHHPVPHQDVGQSSMSQRGQQSQLSKQSQNKGGHQGSYPGPFWSSANKS